MFAGSVGLPGRGKAVRGTGGVREVVEGSGMKHSLCIDENRPLKGEDDYWASVNRRSWRAASAIFGLIPPWLGSRGHQRPPGSQGTFSTLYRIMPSSGGVWRCLPACPPPPPPLAPPRTPRARERAPSCPSDESKMLLVVKGVLWIP